MAAKTTLGFADDNWNKGIAILGVLAAWRLLPKKAALGVLVASVYFALRD
jgi:hypothetical protein